LTAAVGTQLAQPAVPGSRLGGGAVPPLARGLARRPLLLWWSVALALAVLSAVLWPTVPSYDPWSWIVWGREVSDPHISFYVGGGPSWKPLPFLFTTVYGVFGGIAPTLWVITARTGGIAGLIGVFRLSGLLCRRGGLPQWAAWVAGTAAAIGIVLTAPIAGWTYYFFRGTSEPLLIGVWVWAIERLIARRHWQAYMLIAAEGLMRPEAWPFLMLYGAWLFWRVPSMRAWVILGLLAQPVGWFVPPWISTGHPLLAATHAADYNGHLGPDRLRAVLARGVGIQPLPSLALAVLAGLLALWEARRWPRSPAALARRLREDRSEVALVLCLSAAALAWWAIVVAMTIDGYPGLERFYLPAEAIICVLSGYGLLRAAALCGQLAASAARAFRGRAAGASAAIGAARQSGPALLGAGVTVAVLAGLLVGSAPFLSVRWAYARAQEPLAATAQTRIDQLGAAVARFGGKRALLPCRSSVVTINHSLQTALAWKLGTTLERVQTVLRTPGVAFVGPHDSIDGGPPPILYRFKAVALGRVGAWELYRVYPLGQRPPPCLGR
jgi:hypothetical protein